MFKIEVFNLLWINDSEDDPKDLCLHGNVVTIIGTEKFEYNATVSATALYLLKSLTEEHIIYKENQMLPCCGFNMYANNTLDTVDISGCSNGIDWSVIHKGDMVKLISETGKETNISISDYKKEVCVFVDKIEAFYLKCTPKILPNDELDRNGYIAFWNEWHRRRKQA